MTTPQPRTPLPKRHHTKPSRLIYGTSTYRYYILVSGLRRACRQRRKRFSEAQSTLEPANSFGQFVCCCWWRDLSLALIGLNRSLSKVCVFLCSRFPHRPSPSSTSRLISPPKQRDSEWLVAVTITRTVLALLSLSAIFLQVASAQHCLSFIQLIFLVDQTSATTTHTALAATSLYPTESNFQSKNIVLRGR